jgi:hypothetical protein
MNKILVGLIVGAVLGLVDGATAWFTPEVRDQMLGIIIGSTGKGIIAGIAAGWFARRVQSVPKGIAFGFVVGLLLAFAVAAMPGENGEHYWWQIMVPGSILGGVIGWATQRYGRPAASSRSALAATLGIALALVGINAQAGEHDQHGKPAAKNAAFEKLTTLAGKHEANTMTRDGEITRIEYTVTAGGSTVQERLFAGEPHEMITMYTADGDAVLATHYCSGGNQPTMRLNTAKSNDRELVFDFLKITGTVTPSYINGVTFHFAENGAVEQDWSHTGEGPQVKLFFAE